MYLDHTIKNARDVFGRNLRKFSNGIAAYTPPRPALTGTLNTATAANIVTGGKTLIIDLNAGQQWVAAGALFNAQRQNIINGITSRQSEAHGWNIEVKAKAAVTSVVRTSATKVTVTFAAQAGYSISANETIDVVVPASAIQFHRDGQQRPPHGTVTVTT